MSCHMKPAWYWNILIRLCTDKVCVCELWGVRILCGQCHSREDAWAPGPGKASHSGRRVWMHAAKPHLPALPHYMLSKVYSTVFVSLCVGQLKAHLKPFQPINLITRCARVSVCLCGAFPARFSYRRWAETGSTAGWFSTFAEGRRQTSLLML